KNLYVIGSCIQSDCKINKNTEYARKGKLLNESDMIEYSSKDALISLNKVENLFKQLNLL
ncbi:MAG: hypothetical protein NT093_02400, partial [Candidatus Moranbacteria bacterium]|nr:hypothetical protein [Candidatus Moranbacteria bacterium]